MCLSAWRLPTLLAAIHARPMFLAYARLLAQSCCCRCCSLAPDWSKGHYRRGSSLEGLRRHVDAVFAYQMACKISNGMRPPATRPSFSICVMLLSMHAVVWVMASYCDTGSYFLPSLPMQIRAAAGLCAAVSANSHSRSLAPLPTASSLKWNRRESCRRRKRC